MKYLAILCVLIPSILEAYTLQLHKPLEYDVYECKALPNGLSCTYQRTVSKGKGMEAQEALFKLLGRDKYGRPTKL